MVTIQQIEKHIEDIKEQQKNVSKESGNYFHYDWKISILQKELDTIHGELPHPKGIVASCFFRSLTSGFQNLLINSLWTR